MQCIWHDLKLFCIRLAGKSQQIQLTNPLPISSELPAILAARPWSAETLPRISFELSRCRLCANSRLTSAHTRRARLASGRPNTVKKYELKPLSGNWIARVPAGTPENCVGIPVT